MEIKTKTTSGIDVILTGREGMHGVEVIAECVHPKLGKIREKVTWETIKGQGCAHGYTMYRGKIVLFGLLIPKADYDAVVADILAGIDSARADILASRVLVKLHWRQGHPLSGWVAHDHAAELLQEHGVSKPISGWGDIIDQDYVDLLGEEFLWADLEREFLAPRREKHEADQAAWKNKITALAKEAVLTGHDQELDRGMTDCDGSADECSFDLVIRRVGPTGDIKTTRTHCH